MRLLLTSSRITNTSIAGTLKKWVKKPRIVFIPTAANLEVYDKSWLIKNYVECQDLGPVDIVDIAAVPKSVWLPRLQKGNVIVMGGGRSTYLMEKIISSGLEKELPRLLKARVYVGISEGSIVTNKTLKTSSDFFFGKETKALPKGLGLVDFYIRPHLNSPKFPLVKDSNLRRLSKWLDGDLYGIDDDTAIQCENGKVTVVSEGKWKRYPKSD